MAFRPFSRRKIALIDVVYESVYSKSIAAAYKPVWVNHLGEQIEATVFPPFDILQVDGDAAHLAQPIVMTKGQPEGQTKSDTSTAQLGKQCSESYRRKAGSGPM